MLKLPKICRFLIIRAKRAKNWQFVYVKFDIKVEKRGHWVWTEEKKRGSLGVRLA